MNHTKGQKGKRNNPPERQCLACRERKRKEELLRVVRTPEDIRYDPTGKLNGRGAYVCARKECVEKAIRTGALARALKAEIPPGLKDVLSAECKSDDE